VSSPLQVQEKKKSRDYSSFVPEVFAPTAGIVALVKIGDEKNKHKDNQRKGNDPQAHLDVLVPL